MPVSRHACHETATASAAFPALASVYGIVTV
jgi:hypothetical protein